MKRYVLIPDSFKGTMTSAEVCDILREEILTAQPEAEVVSIPVADGGEGSVDAFLAALGGEKVFCPCHGPYMEEMTGFYGLLPGGDTAVVEMAAAAGLPLVGEHRRADRTTTYGVGELIAHAAARGVRKIILGLGGSATNDGGCGAAAALGVQFLNEAGTPFLPVGGTLDQLARVDVSGRSPLLDAIDFVTMCDIDNPLCGPAGASAVFGPQKGANPDMVRRLDENLAHLAAILRRDLKIDVLDLPGGGAAGGMGAGAAAFFGSRLQMGIDTVLDTVDFRRRVAGADLILTGEGQLDSQSLRGKVVVGVARRAAALGVPVVALVGAAETELEPLWALGVTGVFPINPVAKPYDQVKGDCFQNLRFTARNLLHTLTALGGLQ